MRINYNRAGQVFVKLLGNVLLDFMLSAVFLGLGVILMAGALNFVAAGYLWFVLLVIALVSLVVAKYMTVIFDKS